MENKNTFDALGLPIQIGSIYGYSQNKNGFTHIVIGTAIRFAKSGGITLKVIEAKRALYFDEAKPKIIKSTVTVKPLNLFPINR